MENNHEILGELFLRCPMNEELSSCVFKEIRNMSVEKQISMVEAMENEDLENLVCRHRECLAARSAKYQGFRIVRSKQAVRLSQM